MQDSAGRPDEVVAKEFWDGLMKRDNSIFVKLFYGQLKSRVTCSICKNVSITFDPYNVLSVPIPRQSNSQTSYTLKYYPLSFIKPVINITIALTDGDRTEMSDIKEKVKQAVIDQAREEGETIKPEEFTAPILCITKDNRIEMMARSEFTISMIERGFKLVALEREPHISDIKKLVPVQLMITQTRSSFVLYRYPHLLTQSRIMVMRKDWTVKQVKKHIFKLFRPVIQGPMISGQLDRNDPNYSEESVLNAEYKHFFEENTLENDGENIGNQLYRVQVYNNTAAVPGMFFNYRKKCELCDREHKDNCDFGDNDERQKLS